MAKAFVTWNRPEYKEWAIKKSYGYLLLVIRKQAKGAKELINKWQK